MSFTVPQNLFIRDSTVITVVKCDDDAVSMKHLQPLLEAAENALGIAATYDERCKLSSIAFSTLSRVLVVNIPARRVSERKQGKKGCAVRSRSLIQDHFLLNSAFQKYAFTMDQLATALYLDLSIRIKDAVDMLSVTTNDSRQSLQALMNTMGGELNLEKQNVRSLFFATSKPLVGDTATNVALRAWAACRAASLPHMSVRFASLPRIDTTAFSTAHLAIIAGISRHAELLEALKPTFIKNDVTDQLTAKKDAVKLVCSRFSTRIKESENQIIQIEVEGKGATSQVTGRARNVNGRSARIVVNGPIRGNKILSVTTIGKEDPTCAVTTRRAVILETLKHRTGILSSPFFQALWLPKERLMWPESKSKGPGAAVSVHFPRDLNASQYAALYRILSDRDEDRIVLIQGPPGTGKTTVIAASVMSHDSAGSNRNIWVAAQSNVAVKNIAEKFVKEGFNRFKLIVSKDFHFDWHEHLYAKVEQCLIRADRLFKMSIVEASRLLLDCKVILCTLSMLSNPALNELLLIVPVETIILDEASQIECGDYLPIFHRFRFTLSKLVLIGDDKQLPPYGQEDVPDLRSVFEVPHLRRKASFLNIQYRMPHVIGNFISQNVYGGKLHTCHSFTTSDVCYLIDVNRGQEAQMGHSWVNHEEARAVVKLARLYESKIMSFRIITPYDAQRSYIENLLKGEKLKWEDKVFNVDSFQGNEDDQIILSVVRSRKPGFLRSERRTNVMLTRCKQSMVICSSRNFLFGEASNTLIGKLATSLGEDNWINGDDVLSGRVELVS